MRRAKHLFPEVIDFTNLYHAFRAAAAGKRDQPEVREFEFYLEAHLCAGVLTDLLGRRIGDARLLGLLRSLIAHGSEQSGKGMPIGNLTSQLFANLYLDPLDHFAKETLRVRHYIRYMDDFRFRTLPPPRFH